MVRLSKKIEEYEMEKLLQAVAMPADTNPAGDIFGGWLLSQMDLAGGILASRVAKGRVVTVGIDKMNFHLPVFVGDVVSCRGEIIKKGKTSIQLKIEVWVIRKFETETLKVTEGIFSYVKVDLNRKPTLI
jgi:acyl-CoA thioesterase YciA